MDTKCNDPTFPVRDPGMDRKLWYRKVYLVSDHWANLRAKALEFHGSFCSSCKTTERLQVHHLKYRNIHDVTVNDLQILCKVCHDKAHGINEAEAGKKAVKKISKRHIAHLKRLANSAKRKGGRAKRKKAQKLEQKKANISNEIKSLSDHVLNWIINEENISEVFKEAITLELSMRSSTRFHQISLTPHDSCDTRSPV